MVPPVTNKRKSINQNGTPQTPKKLKQENFTPKKGNANTPQKTQSPSNNNSINKKQQQGQTPAKKQMQTPKTPKLEMFSGTASLGLSENATPKQKPGSPNKQISVKSEQSAKKQKQGKNEQSKPDVQQNKTQKSEADMNRSQRRRMRSKSKRRATRDKFKELALKIDGGDAEALREVQEKIKELENKSDKTKSCVRRLRHYKRLVGNTFKTDQPGIKIQKNQQQQIKKQKNQQQPLAGSQQAKGKAKNEQNKVVKQQEEKKGTKQQPSQMYVDDSEESGSEEDEESSDEISNKKAKLEEEGSDDEEEQSGEEEKDDDEGEEEEDDDEEGEDDVEGEEEASDDEDASDNEDEESSEEDLSEQTKKGVVANKNKQNQQQQIANKNNQQQKTANKNKQNQQVGADNSIAGKDKKSRYVVFVGNLPYTVTKQELAEHFKKVGNIADIRIPTDQKTKKPKGFGYIELNNEEEYQKALSLHHTSVNGRRINVLYTQGGKKKTEDRKGQIKAKNFKLQEMRKQGKLAGSVKADQKRSVRRAKKNQFEKS